MLTLKASQTGPHNDVVCSCTLNGFSLGDGMVRDAVLICPDMSNSLEGKYLGVGRWWWKRTGGVKGWICEDRQGGSYLPPPSSNIPSSRFMKGHSPFEAPPKSLCQMALVWSGIQKPNLPQNPATVRTHHINIPSQTITKWYIETLCRHVFS